MVNLLQLDSKQVFERMRGLNTGCYTEQDGGDWYIVTPEHSNRIGEDFAVRDDARRFMCVLAGDPMPKGWTLAPHADGSTWYNLAVGGRYCATIWTRPTIALIRRMGYDTLPMFGANA